MTDFGIYRMQLEIQECAHRLYKKSQTSKNLKCRICCACLQHRNFLLSTALSISSCIEKCSYNLVFCLWDNGLVNHCFSIKYIDWLTGMLNIYIYIYNCGNIQLLSKHVFCDFCITYWFWYCFVAHIVSNVTEIITLSILHWLEAEDIKGL